MSHQPFPKNDDLSEAHVEIEKHYLDLEPKARELNRHLTELLGPCPGNPQGQWAFVSHNELGEFHIALESIPANKVLVLVSRLSEISALVVDELREVASNKNYQPNLGPSIVGEAAQLKSVPVTHVRVVRPS